MEPSSKIGKQEIYEVVKGLIENTPFFWQNLCILNIRIALLFSTETMEPSTNIAESIVLRMD